MATRQMDGVGVPSGPAINLDYIEEKRRTFYPVIVEEYGDNGKKPVNRPLSPEELFIKKAGWFENHLRGSC